MKVSELSRVSGVTVPTIKFYLREGLLQSGAPTGARNQAEYDQAHVHRLRLVRVLLSLGDLSVASTRAVLAAINDADLPVHDMLSVVQRAMSGADAEPATPEIATARTDVDRYLAKRRWNVPEDAPGRRALADALVALRELGEYAEADVFDPYAELADKLAKDEVATIPTDADRAETVEAMVIGTVVFEAALVALRRLAHARHSARRFPQTPGRDRRQR